MIAIHRLFEDMWVDHTSTGNARDFFSNPLQKSFSKLQHPNTPISEMASVTGIPNAKANSVDELQDQEHKVKEGRPEKDDIKKGKAQPNNIDQDRQKTTLESEYL